MSIHDTRDDESGETELETEKLGTTTLVKNPEKPGTEWFHYDGPWSDVDP